MKEIQKLYNQLTENITNVNDLILLVNDLYSVILLIIAKAFELGTNENKNLIVDAIKPMTNSFIQKLMKNVTDNELTIVENDKSR